MVGHIRSHGHGVVRKLSIGSTGHKVNELGICSLCIVEPDCMGYCSMLHHLRLCSWLWWPSELVLIVINLAAIVSAQLRHLHCSFARIVGCDG